MKIENNALYGKFPRPGKSHVIRPAGIKIDVLLHDDMCLPRHVECGDWCDLLTSKGYELKAGDFELLDLGVSMKLPEHLEAHLIVRSSTFKKYGIIQTNGMGIIDNSYCGDNDVWKLPVYATRDVSIPIYTRLCQFRVIAKQPTLSFHSVDTLNSENRGGFGSTGD